jgi:hypothetical protein
MTKAKMAAVGLFLKWASLSNATTYTFPLDLEGKMYGGPDRFINFNLKSTFQSITQVRLDVAGVSTPSVFEDGEIFVMSDAAGQGYGNYSIGLGKFLFSLLPNSTSTGDWAYVNNDGWFNQKLALSPPSQNWDFLLDGQATIGGNVDSGVSIFGNVVFPAMGTVYKAYLIIDGTALTYTDPHLPIVGWEQGDFDGNGKIDVGDLGILAANYGVGSEKGGPGNPWTPADFDFSGDGRIWIDDLGIAAANFPSPYWLLIPGDANYDGKVDVGDLGIIAANYGSGSAAISPIPEPASLLLFGLLFPGLLTRRKK